MQAAVLVSLNATLQHLVGGKRGREERGRMGNTQAHEAGRQACLAAPSCVACRRTEQPRTNKNTHAHTRARRSPRRTTRRAPSTRCCARWWTWRRAATGTGGCRCGGGRACACVLACAWACLGVGALFVCCSMHGSPRRPCAPHPTPFYPPLPRPRRRTLPPRSPTSTRPSAPTRSTTTSCPWPSASCPTQRRRCGPRRRRASRASLGAAAESVGVPWVGLKNL